MLNEREPLEFTMTDDESVQQFAARVSEHLGSDFLDVVPYLEQVHQAFPEGRLIIRGNLLDLYLSQ